MWTLDSRRGAAALAPHTLRDRLRNRAATVRWLPVLTFAVVTFAFMPKALLGLGVLGPFDILEYASPWRDFLAITPHAATLVQNDFVQGVPVQDAIVSALRHGHWLLWTPYIAGGEPVGILNTTGMQSPFNLLLVLLPTGWGLGVVTALRLLFCQTFFYLFARRMKMSSPTATFGAVAYTFCGTNVALLGRIDAYLILPAILWATARVIQRRRPGDVALLAIASALAWLEGFPGGFVNAVTIAVLLALFLIWTAPSAGRRGLLGSASSGLALVACGFALSAGVVAVSVLPFERILTDSGLVQQRAYNAGVHLSPVLLPDALSVGALGNLHQPVLMTSLEPNGTVSGAGNAVELEGGAGLVVVVTALLGVILAVLGRIRLTRAQRSLYLFGLASVIGGLLLVYFDTPLLALFYDLPLLGVSPSNRFRIIINLGFVLVACLGLEGFLASRKVTGGGTPAQAAAPAESGSPPAPAGPDPGRCTITIRICSLLTLVALWLMMRDVWPGYSAWLKNPLAHNVPRDIAIEAAGSLLLSGFVYFALHRAAARGLARRVLTGSGVVLALATFATTAFPIRYFTPTVSSSLVFPRTAGHAELSRLLGTRYRVLGSGLGTFYSDTSVYYHYLDLRGLSISSPAFRTLVKSAIPNAYLLDHFKVIYNPAGDPIRFNSPVLDDLGVRYYVGGTEETAFAKNLGAPTATATREIGSVALGVSIRAHTGLTGLGIPLERGSACEGSRVQVLVTDGSGHLLASSERPAIDAPTASAGVVGFAFRELGGSGPSPVHVAVGLLGPPCHIAVGVNRSGRLDLSQLVRTRGDLRIVAEDQGVFYERPQAHPIVWATGSWLPAGTPSQALALATAPSRRPGGPVPVAGAGRPGSGGGQVQKVSYVSNGFDVRSRTTGSTLIATGFAGSATDWSVDVDGHPGRLASVDGALLGTVVGPGVHTEAFRYEPPDLLLGAGVSGLSILILVGLAIADRRTRRPGGDVHFSLSLLTNA